MQSTPVLRDLVLIGGGHSHVAVLKSLGMKPMPGVRLTLITRDLHTPYSGMLPGYIAGHYERDACHIDLQPLGRFARARIFHDSVIGINATTRTLTCAHRPPLRYDVLSINTGSTPDLSAIEGAREHGVPVKPVDRFIEAWKPLIDNPPVQGARIAIVGGGAGGVELTLALQHRLRNAGVQPHFVLLSADPGVLFTHNLRVQQKFLRILAQRHIELHTEARVCRVDDRALYTEDGRTVPADHVIWTTSASPAPWLADSGLALDGRGFVCVDATLQSTSHPGVFAVGDVASNVDHPRPRSGVFAVRQGPPLADNLRRILRGQPLEPFNPQHQFLSLISTGDRYAVASRGPVAAEGRSLWVLKDFIDRRFMKKYSDLPDMEPPTPETELEGPDALELMARAPMRCGGCGAKVGADVLSRVLTRLERKPPTDDIVRVGLDTPDDAAVIAVPANHLAVQSVDFFRGFLDDPYLLGKVAANHAAGDLWAMGVEPRTALAIAVIPFAREAIVEGDLYALLRGALDLLEACGAELVGGHSSEGSELAFGLQLTGFAKPGSLLRKGGLQPGDALILTRPLGTGTLFAADMRGKARGRWIDEALAHMVQPSAKASQILREHGASAATDVTGFGLLGHLLEMLRASGAGARLKLDALPLLDGALDCIAQGITSSLHPDNARLRRALRGERGRNHAHVPLLFDPQTAGGLLAGVPADRAGDVVHALRQAGYAKAAHVGDVEQGEPEVGLHS